MGVCSGDLGLVDALWRKGFGRGLCIKLCWCSGVKCLGLVSECPLLCCLWLLSVTIRRGGVRGRIHIESTSKQRRSNRITVGVLQMEPS